MKQRWPHHHDNDPDYVDDEPFAWMTERARRRLARSSARNAAFALACAAVWTTIIAASLLRDGWPAAWAFSAYLALAALHMVAALPIQAGRIVVDCADDLLGRGDGAGHQLHLLAIPDLPRPLYFHLWRATLAPFGRNRLAWISAQSGAAWFFLPVGATLAFCPILNEGAYGRLVSNYGPMTAKALPDVGAILLLGLCGSLVVVCSLSLPSMMLSRAAVSLAAAMSGRLGFATGLALNPSLLEKDVAAAIAGSELDEAWEAEAERGVAGWLVDSAKGGMIAAITAIVFLLLAAATLSPFLGLAFISPNSLSPGTVYVLSLIGFCAISPRCLKLARKAVRPLKRTAPPEPDGHPTLP